MRFRFLLVFHLFLLLSAELSAQTVAGQGDADSLDYNLRILKRYLSQGSKWHFTDPLTEKRLSGLIQFIENEPIDSKVLFDRTDKNGNPVLDTLGNKIREPKLQFKEFFTIGFSYKINRRMIRAKEVN